MQVSEELRKCACFIETGTEQYVYLGTAFFVSVALGVADQHAIYVVTAKHCIEVEDDDDPGPILSIKLRLNLMSGGSDLLYTPIESWRRHPVADVAILPLAPDMSVYDYLHWPVSAAATRDFIDGGHYGPGEEVLITGLLTFHPGRTRVLPIVRVGNIAALPEDPVALCTGDDIATLIEVRSIGGLSGSPAYLHMPEFKRDQEGKRVALPDKADPPGAKGGPNRLLGVVHGYPLVSQDDPDKMWTSSEPLNTGITAVVPVERIIELVNDPDLVEERDNLTQALR